MGLKLSPAVKTKIKHYIGDVDSLCLVGDCGDALGEFSNRNKYVLTLNSRKVLLVMMATVEGDRV